jgi:cytidyltransferase-like protein
VPIVKRDEIGRVAEALRREGRKVVFTNGVFDLLHPGHLRYLNQARALGDALIVGVNSDRSVRSNKGEGRPIYAAAERAEILAYEVIAAVQPDVLVKGADWPEDGIVGRDVVEARGGIVVRVPVEPGYSTSSIIEKIRQAR